MRAEAGALLGGERHPFPFGEKASALDSGRGGGGVGGAPSSLLGRRGSAALLCCFSGAGGIETPKPEAGVGIPVIPPNLGAWKLRGAAVGVGVGSGGGAGERAGGCEILGRLRGVSAAGDGKYPGLAECFFRQPLGSVRFLGVSGRACLAFPFFLCADILGSTSRRGILTQGFPPGGLVCVAFCEVWL